MYTYNDKLYKDEYEVDEAIRYELSKNYNGYPTDEMVEEEWSKVEEYKL